MRLFKRAAVGAALTCMASTGLITAVGASPASADYRYCGPSRFVNEIKVENWADGQFKIEVVPTGESRLYYNAAEATNDMWHAIQNCVPGLYDSLADSIYDQLECHQHFAAAWFATGESYDLESWRGTFDSSQWIDTHCGNSLGTDPDGPYGDAFRPDEGNTDLEGSYDYVG